MSTPMRAKLVVAYVKDYRDHNDVVTSQRINFRAVCKNDGPYPADGLDENNTFAKFSPTFDAELMLCNPALLGKYAAGDTFYVDFTPVLK